MNGNEFNHRTSRRMLGKCRLPIRWPIKLLTGCMCGVGLMLGVVSVHASDGSLEVSLSVNVQSRDGRDIPEFIVSIKNVSDDAISVVDVRTDMVKQQEYAPIEIVSVDPLIGLRPSRSEGGSDTDVQYTILPRGGGFEYVASLGIDVSQLVQGKYQAQALYYSEPTDDRITYASPVVEFEILDGLPPSVARKRERLKQEIWATQCANPKSRKFCMIYYQPENFEPGLPKTWFLAISWVPIFNLAVHQFPTCNFAPVVLEIDDNEAMKMKWHGVYQLEGDEARNAVDQFTTGNELVLWVHLTRDCIKREVRIPLDDFRPSWREIQSMPLNME